MVEIKWDGKKRYMKTSELVADGIPIKMLYRAYHTRGQTFATKMNPLKRNSPLLFDMPEFEAWYKTQCEMQARR